MASQSLRSSTKSDGHSTRSSTRINPPSAASATAPLANGNSHTTQQLSNIRRKRFRESASEEEHRIQAKKSRISIEIPPSTKSKAPTPSTRSIAISPPPSLPSPPPDTRRRAASKSKPKQPESETTARVNHHQKVSNGIKHELDRLQPKQEDLKAAAEQKRSLRSQEGSRFKSELSAYFPEYDEIIGNDPKEEHILNLETEISLYDSTPIGSSKSRLINNFDLEEFPDSIFETLHDAKRVDFSFMNIRPREGKEEPLSDAYFDTIHRKPERQERSIRNSDKGRAQHEKDQVIRLLEGLQGHDWLKLMGVSGITESKKRDYESARNYFIAGCESIIEKFRLWRDEEKKRKLERDQAKAESIAEEREGTAVSDGDPPDYIDVDASAARQLHEEAIARRGPTQQPGRRSKSLKSPPKHLHETENFEKPLTSFFPNEYVRDAALGKKRRSNRTSAAWGQPIPDVPENDFDLPEEYRDVDFLKMKAREKRLQDRAKRL